jgi:putative ABC transport system permease protein
VRLTIIGVVDRRAFNTYGIITAARNLAGAGFPRVPSTLYYFRAAPGVDPHVAAHRVEAAYLPHGMQAIVIAEELDDGLGPKQALSYVLEGFMSLTLLMGVVALGLIAGRAVVERRHSVGTMRALGYTRRMVGLAFLAEALFVAALGLAIGGALGLILSKNLFDANFLQQGMALAPSALGTFMPYNPLLTFTIPWPVLAIIDASALLATLLATILPAWQASRIPPAQALRYE